MLKASSFALVVPFAVLALPGCGSSSNGGAPGASDDGGGSLGDGGAIVSSLDAAFPLPDASEASTFVEAPHRAFPQILFQGAKVLSAPKIVSVTFNTDPLATQLDSFGQTVAASVWWDAIRVGYCETAPVGTTCVGDGPTGTSKALTVTFPSTGYTDSSVGAGSTLQTDLLTPLLSSGKLPAPDENTIYVLYLPDTPSSSVTLDGAKTCTDFYGYHGQMTYGPGQGQVVYAVVPECAPTPPPATVLAETTLTASHEIAEAATDPIGTDTTAGFYLDTANDLDTWGWNDLGGGEVADMCDDYWAIGQDEATEGAFTVQRIWSNPSAAGGHDPCIPIPASEKVYFNAAPKTAFFALGVGQSVTFEVDAFSDGPTSDWTLSAIDITDLKTPYLTLTIAGGTTANGTDAGASTQVNNGSKVQVTATLLSDPGETTNFEADALLVSSNGDPSTATVVHYWPIAIVSNADAADAGIDAAAASARPVPRGRAHRVSGRPTRARAFPRRP